MNRVIDLSRTTGETEITGRLDLDGTGETRVSTCLAFLDHMIITLVKHAGFDLDFEARGDLGVDDHHTTEDCAIVIGRGLDAALADRTGIIRFGYGYAPLDESLVRAVVDLSGRGWPEINLPFTREMVGGVAAENLTHFFVSLAVEARMAVHVDLIRGENNHHIAEAGFKALGLALRTAVARSGTGIASTKGSLG